MSYYKTNCCTGKTTFFTKPTSAKVGDEAVVLVFPNTTIDIKNKDLIQFCSTISLQELGAKTQKVQVFINGKTLAIIDKLGNFIRADQLRFNKVFLMSLSTDPNSLVMLTCVCKSTYIRSEVITPITTTTKTTTTK